MWLEEPVQITGPARFRPSPAQALAPKGLRAHHSPDLIAVYINVSGFNRIHHLLHSFINAAMQAKSQAVASGIHGVQYPVEIRIRKSRDMQNRPENFLLQSFDPGH